MTTMNVQNRGGARRPKTQAEAARLLFGPADEPCMLEPVARQGFHVVLDVALLDAALPALDGSALRVLLAVLRHTNGVGVWFSADDLVPVTALDLSDVRRALQVLLAPPIPHDASAGGIIEQAGSLFAINVRFALLESRSPQTR